MNFRAHPGPTPTQDPDLSNWGLYATCTIHEMEVHGLPCYPRVSSPWSRGPKYNSHLIKKSSKPQCSRNQENQWHIRNKTTNVGAIQIDFFLFQNPTNLSETPLKCNSVSLHLPLLRYLSLSLSPFRNPLLPNRSSKSLHFDPQRASNLLISPNLLHSKCCFEAIAVSRASNRRKPVRNDTLRGFQLQFHEFFFDSGGILKNWARKRAQELGFVRILLNFLFFCQRRISEGFGAQICVSELGIVRILDWYEENLRVDSEELNGSSADFLFSVEKVAKILNLESEENQREKEGRMRD